MHTRMIGLRLATGLTSILLIAGMCYAMDIVPHYDANITQDQKDILNQKIALWEARLCSSIVVDITFKNEDLGSYYSGMPPAPAGMELAIGAGETGEWASLGVTDQFQERDDDTPQSARIRFNSNAAIPWHYGDVPVPADKYDFWTTANHEIAHAAGFTTSYTKFAEKVTPGPGDKRTFTCGATTATLTPADEGTHLDPDTHPARLMNPSMNKGERRNASQLEIDMLTGPWEYATVVELAAFSAVTGGRGVEILWETATETDNAGFNLYRGLSSDGPYGRINEKLIAAKGDELQGTTYSFSDDNVALGVAYYYWLEDVDLRGKGTMHGPVSITSAVTFGLAQNSPNPFSLTTEIRYGLPVEADVDLRIFDTRGRNIITLVDRLQPAGYNSVYWDGRNADRMIVSNGIYFCRLQAGDWSETKKMVLSR
jgi:hypothetical protein